MNFESAQILKFQKKFLHLKRFCQRKKQTNLKFFQPIDRTDKLIKIINQFSGTIKFVCFLLEKEPVKFDPNIKKIQAFQREKSKKANAETAESKERPKLNYLDSQQPLCVSKYWLDLITSTGSKV